MYVSTSSSVKEKLAIYLHSISDSLIWTEAEAETVDGETSRHRRGTTKRNDCQCDACDNDENDEDEDDDDKRISKSPRRKGTMRLQQSQHLISKIQLKMFFLSLA